MVITKVRQGCPTFYLLELRKTLFFRRCQLTLKELSRLKVTKASGPDGITARRLKDAAPVIAKPITYLVNLTISTGLIPTEWKDARVTPIFKSGARNDVNNYRPISVLPPVSRIMERAIQVQLLAFLTEHDLLSDYQSGFREKHSTETAGVYIWIGQ